MALIQIKRDSQEAIEQISLAEGELAVALDTGNVYIGTTSGNVHLNPILPTLEEITNTELEEILK